MGNHRENRDEDDGQDDEGKVVFDDGDVAEEVTGEGKQSYPDDTPEDIVGNKFAVVHFADAGYKGGKSAHNGNKTGKKDSLVTVFSKEFLSFI